MRISAVIAFLISVSANASITEGGRGMLFGEDHAFAVTAKLGWVLDNQSGVSQGLHMVFYPIESTWSDSPVIIYGLSMPTSEVETVNTQVEQTVSDFRGDGSPNYTGEAQTPIILPNGRKANLYHFSGDQWGNYEAAAYFQEVDTINYLVFNSRTKENFEKYIGDFRQIVNSYQNLYTSPTTITINALDSLKKESSSILTKPEGKEYESKAVHSVGQAMANTMQDCTSYFREKELPVFSYYVRINSDGSIADSYIFPTSALSACFKGLMSSASYPAHPFRSFVLNIEMKVSP